MPLVCHQIHRLCVLGHDQLAAFLANDAASGVAHGQVRVGVFVARQTLAFAGVVHVQRGAALRHYKTRVDRFHSVCAPSTGGCADGSGMGGIGSLVTR